MPRDDLPFGWLAMTVLTVGMWAVAMAVQYRGGWIFCLWFAVIGIMAYVLSEPSASERKDRR